MGDNFSHGIEQAARILRRAKRVCCLTGAGVSAESGVPTFRGAGGLWQGQRAESLATPEAFEENPQEVWRFYLWRRGILKGCSPNAGHSALAKLEQILPEFTLITQNVDGLHWRAGSRRVLALHGDIWIDRCTGCGRESQASGNDLESIPHCAECGAMARPGVVWFGEFLPSAVLAAAEEACSRCEVMLVVGTSSVVYPAASLAPLARSAGASVVEINPQSTPLTAAADLVIVGPSAQVLPAIVERLKEEWG